MKQYNFTSLQAAEHFMLEKFFQYDPSIGEVLICCLGGNYNSKTLKYYFNDGLLHRTTGPALIRAKEEFIIVRSYYLNGKYIEKKEDWFNKLTNEQKIEALMNPENF